ncbi:hypothetical protein ACP70R_016782 [Stipagrostis hirtigluma subsp. patula]
MDGEPLHVGRCLAKLFVVVVVVVVCPPAPRSVEAVAACSRGCEVRCLS